MAINSGCNKYSNHSIESYNLRYQQQSYAEQLQEFESQSENDTVGNIVYFGRDCGSQNLFKKLNRCGLNFLRRL